MTYINLEKYFNHTIVYDTGNTNNKNDEKVKFDMYSFAELNMVNLFYGIDFLLPRIAQDKFDNIECNGQTIPVLGSNIQEIYLLAFSVDFILEDNVKVIYKDKTEAVSRLKIHPCNSTEIPSDVKTAFKGKDLSGNPVNIYFYKLNFQPKNSPIKSIVCPVNKNFHIISLTTKLLDAL